MTPADAISILDAEIADIKSRINSVSFNNNSYNYIESPGNRLKRDVIKTLQKIGSRGSTLQAIENVSFENRYSGPFAYQFYGQRDVEAGLERCFQEGINAIITILQQEREHFLRIKQDQEKQKESAIQKRNNRIQIWTLITSIAAIILSAISLGFTIFS